MKNEAFLIDTITLADPLHDYKLKIVKSMINMCTAPRAAWRCGWLKTCCAFAGCMAPAPGAQGAQGA